MRKRNNVLKVGILALMAFALVASCFQTGAIAAETKEKTWQWYPSTWQPSGVVWDRLVYISDLITRGSGGRIAWEAHAFGYVVGLLAIGPLIRWFANTKPGFDSTPRLGDPVD